MDKKIIVIKYGGHAMDIPEIRDAFSRDLLEMRKDGFSFVIVHGGGPHISQLLDRLGIESHFENGLRVTDEAVLQAVEMALCGQVNKEVVRFLEKAGNHCAGISGEDGPTLWARKKDARLGQVGEVTRVDPKLILNLINGGYLPVIAPLGLNENFEPLNINADIAAGAIAGSLKASFILLSDVPGVLDGEGRLVSELDKSAIENLVKKEIIKGGMIPKVQSCLNALECGSPEAIILDGREKNNLKRFLTGKSASGTIVRK